MNDVVAYCIPPAVTLSRTESLFSNDCGLENRVSQAEELKFQQEETEVLQKEKAEVEAQNVSLARELELLMEKDKEYAKLGVKRSTDNRDLSAKVRRTACVSPLKSMA